MQEIDWHTLVENPVVEYCYKLRRTGKTAGNRDTYYRDKRTGRRFRSKRQIDAFYAQLHNAHSCTTMMHTVPVVPTTPVVPTVVLSDVDVQRSRAVVLRETLKRDILLVAERIVAWHPGAKAIYFGITRNVKQRTAAYNREAAQSNSRIVMEIVHVEPDRAFANCIEMWLAETFYGTDRCRNRNKGGGGTKHATGPWILYARFTYDKKHVPPLVFTHGACVSC